MKPITIIQESKFKGVENLPSTLKLLTTEKNSRYFKQNFRILCFNRKLRLL